MLVHTDLGNLNMLTKRQFIQYELTEKFNLTKGIKDKATFSVRDLYHLLHYHWCQDDASSSHGRYRVQTAFLMQLIAYTSSRPGAIIESRCYKGQDQVLKFKVCSYLLLMLLSSLLSLLLTRLTDWNLFLGFEIVPSTE